MVLFWVSLQRTEARCVAGALGSGPAWAPHCPSLGLTFPTRGRGSTGKVVRPAGDNQQEGHRSCAGRNMLLPGVPTSARLTEGQRIHQ